MNGSTVTNVWLGVLATISLLQFLMIAVASLLMYKTYKRAAPLLVRVDAILDEVEGIASKVTQAQESVGRVLDATAGVSSLIAGTVIARTWPILGIVQGLRTATNTLLHPSRPER